MKKIYEDIKKVFESNLSSKILIGIGFFIVAILIFSAGVSVGFRKASFGRAWGENYEHNFGMKPNRMMFGKDNFPNSHGAAGKIIKIEIPTVIVQDKDNIEKVILIGQNTRVQKLKDSATTADLKVDDFIVVIGNPNEQGQIEAKFIRVMPLGMPVPPSSFPATAPIAPIK